MPPRLSLWRAPFRFRVAAQIKIEHLSVRSSVLAHLHGTSELGQWCCVLGRPRRTPVTRARLGVAAETDGRLTAGNAGRARWHAAPSFLHVPLLRCSCLGPLPLQGLHQLQLFVLQLPTRLLLLRSHPFLELGLRLPMLLYVQSLLVLQLLAQHLRPLFALLDQLMLRHIFHQYLLFQSLLRLRYKTAELALLLPHCTIVFQDSPRHTCNPAMLLLLEIRNGIPLLLHFLFLDKQTLMLLHRQLLSVLPMLYNTASALAHFYSTLLLGLGLLA
mmetsp:Transcript_30101/g.77576  ORF Transcript_30101/g.77576 Transcript_30101/m.77576 type:complete len:273 (+) Transcript_30101:781-1599(+)